MKILKSGLMLVSALSLVLTLVFGCSSKEEGAAPPAEKLSQVEKTSQSGHILPEPKPIEMPEFLTVCGGTTPGRSAHLEVSALVKAIGDAYPDTKVRHIPAGSTESLLKTAKGQYEIGYTTAIDSVELAFGIGAFDKKNGKYTVGAIPDFRWLACFPLPKTNICTVMVVPADSPIKSIADLRNKKIAFPTLGNSTGVYVEKIWKHNYGFDIEDIKAAGGMVARAGWSAAAGMLAAGTVDACLTIIHPLPSLSQMAMTKGLRYLKWSEKDYEYAEKELYIPRGGTCKAGTYTGQDEDWHGFCIVCSYISHKSLPDDVAYNILVALYKDNASHLLALGGPWAKIDWVKDGGENAWVMGKPHPGAAEFWKDFGYKIPKPLADYP